MKIFKIMFILLTTMLMLALGISPAVLVSVTLFQKSLKFESEWILPGVKMSLLSIS